MLILIASYRLQTESMVTEDEGNGQVQVEHVEDGQSQEDRAAESEEPALPLSASAASSSAAAAAVVIDALPYIDEGYDEPGVREAVSTGQQDFYV